MAFTVLCIFERYQVNMTTDIYTLHNTSEEYILFEQTFQHCFCITSESHKIVLYLVT